MGTVRETRLRDLVDRGAVCVVICRGDAVRAICYNPSGESPSGTRIRTYLPGGVGGRWDGPLLASAPEVIAHLRRCEGPCSVPVRLARRLFGWPLPFAELPGPG